jgi:hypothetical protein
VDVAELVDERIDHGLHMMLRDGAEGVARSHALIVRGAREAVWFESGYMSVTARVLEDGTSRRSTKEAELVEGVSKLLRIAVHAKGAGPR